MTTAAALQFLIAALALVFTVAVLVGQDQIIDEFRVRAANTDATQDEIDGVVAVLRVVFILGAIITLVLALVMAGLAFLNLRGSNPARITTWVLSVLGLCCGVCGTFGTIVSGNTQVNTGDTDTETASQLGDALADSYPGWFEPLNGGVSVLQALGYIAVAVLLALPASNEFFSRRRAGGQPRP